MKTIYDFVVMSESNITGFDYDLNKKADSILEYLNESLRNNKNARTACEKLSKDIDDFEIDWIKSIRRRKVYVGRKISSVLVECMVGFKITEYYREKYGHAIIFHKKKLDDKCHCCIDFSKEVFTDIFRIAVAALIVKYKYVNIYEIKIVFLKILLRYFKIFSHNRWVIKPIELFEASNIKKIDSEMTEEYINYILEKIGIDGYYLETDEDVEIKYNKEKTEEPERKLQLDDISSQEIIEQIEEYIYSKGFCTKEEIIELLDKRLIEFNNMIVDFINNAKKMIGNNDSSRTNKTLQVPPNPIISQAPSDFSAVDLAQKTNELFNM